MLFALAAIAAPASLALVLWDINRANDRHLAFLVLTIWSRYVIAAFPQYTSLPVAAGLSVSAIMTFLIAGLGVLLVAPRTFLLRSLIPLYLLMGMIAISGIANQTFSGIVVGCLRLTYLLVLQLALYNAAMRVGVDRVVRSLLIVFCFPLSMQWASIVLGIEKLSGVTLPSWQDLDVIGHNYVGSYDHESMMSIMLVTFLFVLLFWRTRSPVFWGCVALGVAGLHFSNYRTVTLAGGPVILAILFTRYFAMFNVRSRFVAVALLVSIVLPVMLAVLVDGRLAERFEDVGAISELDLMRDTYQLSEPDRDLLTGRYYIWVEYVSAWRHGSLKQGFIGFGPESWKGTFVMYAHNLYISTLYELGAIGLVILFIYLLHLIYLCFRINDRVARLKLLAGYAGFLIMSFATMPMWKIEGLIFLAVLNGSALSLATLSRRQPAQRRLVTAQAVA